MDSTKKFIGGPDCVGWVVVLLKTAVLNGEFPIGYEQFPIGYEELPIGYEEFSIGYEELPIG